MFVTLLVSQASGWLKPNIVLTPFVSQALMSMKS